MNVNRYVSRNSLFIGTKGTNIRGRKGAYKGNMLNTLYM